MKQIYLTKDGLKDLEKELTELKDEKRPQLVKRVTAAREMGDLSENTEYAAVREELNMMDGRIEELEQIMSRAKVIQGCKANGQVSLGCKVTLVANGQTHDYTVVGEWEADPMEKKISHSSPLGKALLGKKSGDEIELEVPAGKVVYEIKKIH